MNERGIREKARGAFYKGAHETANPYDRHTRPREYAAWRDAHWQEWREYKRRHKDWFGDAASD